MAAPDVYQEALALLSPPRTYGFEWLVESDIAMFTIAEVADRSRLGKETLRRLCEEGTFPNAMNFQPPQIGWRIPKRDLVMYFAQVRQNTLNRGRETA